MKLKVEGYSDLYRDSSSQAIYSTDRDALLAAKRRKKEILAEKQRLDKLEEDVHDIKSSLNLILTLLSDKEGTKNDT